jgi:hypothetical protein
MKHIYTISGRSEKHAPFAAFNQIGNAIAYLRKLALRYDLTFCPSNNAYDSITGKMVYTLTTVVVLDEKEGA